MAALVEGQQYGLSVQDKINKSLIFVKLTDSALRAIESYVKNKGENSSQPTIQFQGNSGFICLPSASNNYAFNQSYNFTLSNIEAEGPQGSFECLQQSGIRSLESLGCLQMKMQIHANEDSYEKTRVKMAAAEQESKKFCTKEIKPAGAHLNRKIKVKRSGLPLSPVKPSSPPLNQVPPKNPLKPLNSSLGSSNNNFAKKPEIHKQPSHVANQNKTPPNPELMKQSLRDRLIHILAVRPYKKPELIVRLNREGIKEKEKKGISTLLSQIALLKENAYCLSRSLWNEVQDNWKYANEGELAIIRKKKQQFLSHSESSNHSLKLSNKSPHLQKRVSESVGLGHDVQSKKQRISHYNRSETLNSHKTDSSDSNNSDKKSQASTLTNSFPAFVQSNGQTYTPCQKSANMNVHNSNVIERNSISNGLPTPLHSLGADSLKDNKITHNHSNSQSNGINAQINNENSFTQEQSIAKNAISDVNTSNQVNSFNSSLKNNVNTDTSKSQYRPAINLRTAALLSDSNNRVSPDSSSCYQGKEDSSKTLTNGYVNSDPKNGYKNLSFMNHRSKINSTVNGSCSTSPHSSSDSRDSMDYNGPDQVPSQDSHEYGYPEYLKKYDVIKSSDQRARYKADFNAQYEEYLRLYNEVKSIQDKFSTLEEELIRNPPGSEKFMEIRGRIIKEYISYQQNTNYFSGMKRFHQLHSKLSHIKRLVMEYDNAHTVKS